MFPSNYKLTFIAMTTWTPIKTDLGSLSITLFFFLNFNISYSASSLLQPSTTVSMDYKAPESTIYLVKTEVEKEK